MRCYRRHREIPTGTPAAKVRGYPIGPVCFRRMFPVPKTSRLQKRLAKLQELGQLDLFDSAEVGILK